MARIKTDPNALFLGLVEKTKDAKEEPEEQPKESRQSKAGEKTQAADKPIGEMSLEELKEYAKSKGIPLKNARTKPEIKALIEGKPLEKKEGKKKAKAPEKAEPKEPEKEKMVLITANLPESLKRDLDKLVFQKKMEGEKTSLTQVIRDCLEAELKKQGIR